MSFIGGLFKKAWKEDPVISRLKLLSEDLKYTPDAPLLERRYDQFVFIPDEMMSTHQAHDKLGESSFKLSLGFTDEKYTFWKQDFGKNSSAIPMEGNYEDVIKARIKGELYLVRSPQVFELDKYHQNGIASLRKPVKILIPYRRAKNYRPHDKAAYEWLVSRTQFMGELHAWMYVGINDYWDPLLLKGSKLKHTSKSGIKSLTRFNDHGIFSTVSCFKPNNPDLDIYFYFVNAKTGSNDS